MGMYGAAGVSTDSARVRKRREITGINRTIGTREPAARLARPTARSTRDNSKKLQVSAQYHPLSSCRAITIRWIWFVPS
jgi:hypothetical protein